MSLNSTICDNISLNLAMPKEYLNPPVPEQSDDGTDSACESKSHYFCFQRINFRFRRCR